MKIKIECEIEFDETLWFNDEDEEQWFIETLNDKEITTVILWSNECGDEIGQTTDFKYTLL